MKLVVQRVSEATVSVNDKIVGQIDKGLVVLIGIGVNDTKKQADYLINKLLKLRVFEDENGKMNIPLKDVNGKLLLISQFTLYSSHKKNRPSFHRAMNGADAEKLYDYFCSECQKEVHVEKGVFGEYMKVSLVNEGPVTLIIEKND